MARRTRLPTQHGDASAAAKATSTEASYRPRAPEPENDGQRLAREVKSGSMSFADALTEVDRLMPIAGRLALAVALGSDHDEAWEAVAADNGTRAFAVYSEHHEQGRKPVSTHATLLRAELAACEWNGHAWITDVQGTTCAAFRDKRRAPIEDPYRATPLPVIHAASGVVVIARCKCDEPKRVLLAPHCSSCGGTLGPHRGHQTFPMNDAGEPDV